MVDEKQLPCIPLTPCLKSISSYSFSPLGISHFSITHDQSCGGGRCRPFLSIHVVTSAQFSDMAKLYFLRRNLVHPHIEKVGVFAI